MYSYKLLLLQSTLGFILLTTASSLKHKSSRHAVGSRRNIDYHILHLPEKTQKTTVLKTKNQTDNSETGKRHLMKVRVIDDNNNFKQIVGKFIPIPVPIPWNAAKQGKNIPIQIENVAGLAELVANRDDVDDAIHGSENNRYVPKSDEELNKEHNAEETTTTSLSVVEGDIRVSGTIDRLRDAVDPKESMSVSSLTWPDKIIPYTFHTSAGDKMKKVVESAIEDFGKYTCISFIPRTTEDDYILFMAEKGCWSFVGKQGGMQPISLGDDCHYKGTVLHQLMHSLGFFHEHTRSDRDKYISINYDNIMQGKADNFKKYGKGDANEYGDSYDFYSIMHYRPKAFSKNNEYTIMPKDKSIKLEKIGQRTGFSSKDIKKIEKAYKCKKKPTPDQTAESVPSKLTKLITNQNKKPHQNVMSAFKNLTSSKTKEMEPVQNVEVPKRVESPVLKPPGNPGPGMQANGTVFPPPLPNSVDASKLAAGVKLTPSTNDDNVKLAPLPAPKLEEPCNSCIGEEEGTAPEPIEAKSDEEPLSGFTVVIATMLIMFKRETVSYF